jgi:putative peptidoglycan lipid II flippase
MAVEVGRGARIAGAAALIAGLTIVARLAGFGRTMVFAWAVGDTDLGDTYVVANTVPNIIFEIVAGGALASLVVPLLAPAIVAGDRAEVTRTASALLTWVLVALVPLAAAVAMGARPLIELIATDPSPAQVEAGTRMLRIFAPQLPLYGVAIVLTGVLQAHRRFAWPVLAPLLSSVTVAAAYLLFAGVDRRGVDVAGVTEHRACWCWRSAPHSGWWCWPAAWCRRCAARGAAATRLAAAPRTSGAGWAGLAVAGAVTLATQNLALLVVLWRAWAGPEGTNVLFLLAQTIFLVPWAVLAVPLATAAYPTLAESAVTGADERRYRATLAGATRATVLLCLFGAAALAALAVPMAGLVAELMPTAPDSAGAAGRRGSPASRRGWWDTGCSRCCPGRCTRAARPPGRRALAAALGWAAVAAAAVALSAALPAGDRVLALTVSNSLGMTLLGGALLHAVRRRAGRAALAGLPRVIGGGTAAAAAATAAGWAAARWLDSDTPTIGSTLWSGMLAGAVVVGVFLAVAWLLDRRDVEPLVSAGWRRLRAGRR